MAINTQDYLTKVHAPSKRDHCKTDSAIVNDLTEILLNKGEKILEAKNIEFTGTLVLDKSLFCDYEFNGVNEVTEFLPRARVVSVNPGSDNIGNEQRYIHYYIVLSQVDTMFVGVPITNMAYNNAKGCYYLRNPFEVELKNPNVKTKPFNQYWVKKPSVADIRNICGFDKRRIIQNNLFASPKYAPTEYMDAIKSKIKIIFDI